MLYGRNQYKIVSNYHPVKNKLIKIQTSPSQMTNYETVFLNCISNCMSWALDDFYTGHEKGSLSVVRNDMSKAPTKAQTSEKQFRVPRQLI